MNRSDPDLIKSFADAQCEESFKLLVQRHLDLVYGTATRLVSDRGVAEEITQNVFLTLARKGKSLNEHPTLAGWLYKTTINKSRERIRAESRRIQREQLAASAQEHQSKGDSIWAPLVPVLDEGILELKESDRLTVILHFIEGRTFSQIGQLLGVGEDAARKRLRKSLIQLTQFFRKQGYEIPNIAPSSRLFAIATPPASATLAAKTLAGVTTSLQITATASATATTSIMTMSKAKAILAGTLVVAGVTGPYAYQHQTKQHLKNENIELRNEVSNLARRGNDLSTPLSDSSQEQGGEQIRNLKKEIASLRTQNRLLTNGSGGTAVEANASFVRLNKENLAKIHFKAIDLNFQLTSEAADLLEFSATEAEEVQHLLQELRIRVQDHDVSEMQIAPLHEIADSDIRQFIENTEGEKTVYRVSPFQEPDKTSIKEWFYGRLDGILGEERKSLFQENSQQGLDFWLGGEKDKLIAFVDRFDDSGERIDHEFMVKLETPSMSGTYSGSLNRPVPPMLQYLFEGVAKQQN
jgi:RNA polymerase sigma factor (sigma-70 family)